MATKLALTRDINGFVSYGLVTADDKYDTTLALGVAQTLTVPTIPTPNAGFRKWLAIFSFNPGASVFVAINNTAALPGSGFAATTSELNPTSREVKGGDTISFITNDSAAYVGVSLYAIQQQ